MLLSNPLSIEDTLDSAQQISQAKWLDGNWPIWLVFGILLLLGLTWLTLKRQKNLSLGHQTSKSKSSASSRKFRKEKSPVREAKPDYDLFDYPADNRTPTSSAIPQRTASLAGSNVDVAESETKSVLRNLPPMFPQSDFGKTFEERERIADQRTNFATTKLPLDKNSSDESTN